jgi:dTDP-glucose pyrophosphorylase
MKDFTKYTIKNNASCLEALRKLELEDTNQTLFVIDESDRLIGTLTDGDIRRGFIKGLQLDSSIDLFCFQNFSYINSEINVSEIRKLRNEGKKVIPKINKQGQIEKVYDLSNLNSILPLNAIIMAGGRGERLRPLTDNTPKPMLLLGEKPIIEHNIDRLISYGIDSITISVRYLSDQIINYFGDGSSKGISINYIEESTPLGTIGCLSMLKEIKHNTLLVLNSDIFSNLNYEDFYLDFIDTNADMAVASFPYSVDIPYAIMEIKDDCIISFKEKPKNTYYANAGIYMIKKESLSNIPPNSFYNATDLMDSIINKGGKLIHSPITGFWIDIGKHDDYNKAKEILKHL